MERRKFISATALLFSYNLLLSCLPSAKKISAKTKIISSDTKVAHRLRTNDFPPVSEQESIDTLIIGAGVSGLSAARHFIKNNFNDFKIIELDAKIGGNAKAGENEISKYPLAAHYLPLPNNDFKELLQFLEEHEIVLGYDSIGLPIYNELYICFEPHERFFYRGIWYDGIPPKAGLLELEEKELTRFMSEVDAYKNKRGSDNKLLFTLPVENCSNDAAMMQLDNMSINDYLKQNKYQSEFLYWYLNYCCKDDYGSNIENTSAWAAFHYFASRTGLANNASANDILTWPEGNNFLLKKLANKLNSYLLNKHVAYEVQKKQEQWIIKVFDAEQNTSKEFSCKNIILASPQFANKKLLSNIEEFKTIDWSELNYYPWIVANISINKKNELNGIEELSWDNVMHYSKSLGYVNARHQILQENTHKTVISYYYNFSDELPRLEREKVRNFSEQDWEKFILDDLKTAHPNILQLVEEIEVNVLGHGMISPNVGFRSSKLRGLLDNGLKGLYFANTDVSGISIFEQGFYRGIKCANNVLANRV